MIHRSERHFLRILLTSVGRRGYLVRYFKDALGETGEVWGGDCNPNAPAFQKCDRAILLPRVSESDYVGTLLQVCHKHEIDLVIPLLDPELEVLSKERDRFFEENIFVVVSPFSTIQLAFDKMATYQFCVAHNIPAPRAYSSVMEAEEVLHRRELTWPVVVKPRKGSASQFITICKSMDQLVGAFQGCPNPMIQQYIDGPEYGLDLFGSWEGRLQGVFCKKKLEMRAGETDKAVTVVDEKLLHFGRMVVEHMPIVGPIDLDLRVDAEGPKLLEINPRFGGGYPCSHLNGAAFPEHLVAMVRGQRLEMHSGPGKPGIIMLKQDEILMIPPDTSSIELDYRVER